MSSFLICLFSPSFEIRFRAWSLTFACLPNQPWLDLRMLGTLTRTCVDLSLSQFFILLSATLKLSGKVNSYYSILLILLSAVLLCSSSLLAYFISKNIISLAICTSTDIIVHSRILLSLPPCLLLRATDTMDKFSLSLLSTNILYPCLQFTMTRSRRSCKRAQSDIRHFTANTFVCVIFRFRSVFTGIVSW